MEAKCPVCEASAPVIDIQRIFAEPIYKRWDWAMSVEPARLEYLEMPCGHRMSMDEWILIMRLDASRYGVATFVKNKAAR